MLFALGLGDSVVAVTHECDYPPQALTLPQITRTVLSDDLQVGEIDATVKETMSSGQALYELDEERLAELAPDVIVTQALCAVCAVSIDDVLDVSTRLPSRPRIVQHDPSTLAEMLEDIVRLGEVAGKEAEAHELRGDLEGRLAAVRGAVAGATPPRVIAMEWLDPPYVGGHWVPEMISIAGGDDVAGPPGLKSSEVWWGALSGLNPDVVIVMPCGWYAEEAQSQALAHWPQIQTLGASRVFAVDAASAFSRPGPRLVDGVELLGHILHPTLVDAPGNIAFAELPAGPLTGLGHSNAGGYRDGAQQSHHGQFDR